MDSLVVLGYSTVIYSSICKWLNLTDCIALSDALRDSRLQSERFLADWLLNFFKAYSYQLSERKDPRLIRKLEINSLHTVYCQRSQLIHNLSLLQNLNTLKVNVRCPLDQLDMLLDLADLCQNVEFTQDVTGIREYLKIKGTYVMSMHSSDVISPSDMPYYMRLEDLTLHRCYKLKACNVSPDDIRRICSLWGTYVHLMLSTRSIDCLDPIRDLLMTHHRSYAIAHVGRVYTLVTEATKFTKHVKAIILPSGITLSKSSQMVYPTVPFYIRLK